MVDLFRVPLCSTFSIDQNSIVYTQNTNETPPNTVRVGMCVPFLNQSGFWEHGYRPNIEGDIRVVLGITSNIEIRETLYLLTIDPEKLDSMLKMFSENPDDWNFSYRVVPRSEIVDGTVLLDQNEFLNMFVDLYFGWEFCRRQKKFVVCDELRMGAVLVE